ncbi:MAG: hypothetical protein Barrevirus2_20 [Barrevirus sp.]|uniref:ribonucleoside-diphosphate reductase n=1 Tax=Barrevirus sp. TaxID=2487763 RepID=A0A3G4ZPR2_9VIRU|nr:MAG: hypothetical protein Barrevirus2_20 [Barrevirus sp.]
MNITGSNGMSDNGQLTDKSEIHTSEIILKDLIGQLGYDTVYSLLVDKLKPVHPLDLDEDILNEENWKFTTLPIKYQSVWKLYKEQMASFWKEEEIDLSSDYDDFMTLNQDEQYFIEMILAFFAAQDGIVNMNLSERFMKEIKVTEILYTYQWQAMMENVHCVSGNTRILTDKGYKKITDILFKFVKVWNGKAFSETFIMYTGKSPLYKVKLSNGMELECTPEHKWFIRTGNPLHPERSKRGIIFTKDLKIGNIIHCYDLPVIDNPDPDEFMNPYIHGLHSGDGTYCNGYPKIELYGEKKKLLPYFGITKYTESDEKIVIYITTKINKQKYVVPINYSKNTKLRWLEGICDSDGCINYNTKLTGTSIQISNTNYDFLKNIQLMLTTLGINTNIALNREEGKMLLPGNSNRPGGKKRTKLSDCKACYILYITISNVNKLHKMGFTPNRLKIKCNDKIVERAKLIKITKISLIDGIHATYCFNEPKEHAGIFNGILTGQSTIYSLMLENIIKDKTRRDFLFKAMQNIPSVKAMSDWALQWIQSSKSFAHRIIAFAIVEGIFFSGAFAAIYWIKGYKNKNRDMAKGKPFMDGLNKSNKFIQKDEAMHCRFACLVYSLLKKRLSEIEVKELISEGVKLAKDFMCNALKVNLIGMNSDMMCEYLEYIGDTLLVMLGYTKQYGKKNPFKFMENIGLSDKTNFFETRPHEYQDAHVMNTGNKSNITINEEF